MPIMCPFTHTTPSLCPFEPSLSLSLSFFLSQFFPLSFTSLHISGFPLQTSFSSSHQISCFSSLSWFSSSYYFSSFSSISSSPHFRTNSLSSLHHQFLELSGEHVVASFSSISSSLHMSNNFLALFTTNFWNCVGLKLSSFSSSYYQVSSMMSSPQISGIE